MQLNKKILRTILEHKSQYLGLVLLTTFGCFTFTMFQIFGVNLLENLDYFKGAYQQEDAHFITQQQVEGIEILEEKYDVIIEKRLIKDLAFNGDTTLRMMSSSKLVNKHVVIEGHDLKSASDVLLDREFAAEHHIEIGQHIKLGEIQYEVTGFFASPDYIYVVKFTEDLIKNPATFGVAIVDVRSFDKLDDHSAQYSIFYNGLKADGLEALKNEIHREAIVLNWIEKADNMRMAFVEHDMKGIGPLSSILPITIMLVTSLFLSVVFSRLIHQERALIGLCYAVGYRRGEIYRHYMRYVLFITCLGGFLGTFAGALLVKPYLKFAAQIYNIPIFSIEYSYLVLALSLAFPFVFLVPTILLVTRRALNSTPINLLRSNDSSRRIGVFEKHIRLERLSFSNQFKIREILRNIPRVGLLCIGVIVASWLILIGFVMRDSLNHLVSESLEGVFQYEYRYTFNFLQDQTVRDGEPSSVGKFEILQDDITQDVILVGLKPDSKLISFRNKSNQTLLMNQTIISNVIAERFNLKVGDQLEIKNAITDKHYIITVDAIIDSYLSPSIYMPIDEVNTMCSYPEGSYLEVYANKPLNFKSSDIRSTLTKEDMIQGYHKMMAPLSFIAYGIGVVALIIGLIILYVVISMVVQENKTTISMLKILGYRNVEIYKLVLNSLTVFVTLSFLISLPISLSTMDGFLRIMTEEMGMLIPIKLEMNSIIFSYLLVIGIYELAKFSNKRKVNRISMADSLKNRNE